VVWPKVGCVQKNTSAAAKAVMAIRLLFIVDPR
jgi:hypothetical protein